MKILYFCNYYPLHFLSRKWMLMTLFFLIFQNSFSQQASIFAHQSNVLYRGSDNPLVVTIENCDCKKVYVSADSCQIRKIRDCQFLVTPLKDGKVILNVSRKKKLLWKFSFNVEIPRNTVFLGEFHNGDVITINDLRRIGGIQLDYKFPWLHSKIESFFVMHLRDNMPLKTFSFKGRNLLTGFIDALEKDYLVGDKLIFFNIEISQEGGRRIGNPIEVFLE